ncbi:MAG TPA: MerR family transcriptional regulator [Roseiarcus sp.]|jgi:DNA-binding transcriptional MerR regulator
MILSPRAPTNGPSEKSPEAYRTIREVADSLDLPQHVLRFWETRFPQIRPLKRAGGRRYYRPDDIERLRLIRRLLYDEGYTIKGVQKLFKEQGVQALSAAAASAPISESTLEAQGAGEASGETPQGPGARASQLNLADDEIAALREALAEIGDAERILAQALNS